MTIYSRHPSRGKVQILATYRGSAGVTSSTVTSVDQTKLATPIVDALNRISACATVPVSVWDTRGDYIRSYPTEHLAALTDRSARTGLLEGAHSLWYEHVRLLLHKALTDLDEAIAALPAPVRTAVAAELEAEEHGLCEALAEFSEGISAPDAENQRLWDFGFPFVEFDGGMEALGSRARDWLNRKEEGISAEQRQTAVGDLRLLVDAYEQCSNGEAVLDITELSIFHEPFGSDRYYLTVDPPSPKGDDIGGWSVEIGQWDVDLDEAEDGTTAHGESVLRCVRSTPPTASEIAELLDRSGGDVEQLATWAKTPVGQKLNGTAFVVTEHFDR